MSYKHLSADMADNLSQNKDLAVVQTEPGHKEEPITEQGHAEANGHEKELSANEVPQSQIFDYILNSQLGSHNEIGFYDAFHTSLPVIIIDDGFYFYTSPEAMEEAGVFTEVGHHKVRAEDGQAPALDLSITSLVAFQWIAMFIVLLVFGVAAGKYKKRKEKAPKGLQNAVEAMYLYIRDEVVRPNAGNQKVADKLLPYFIALFFFILGCNLLGLIPGGHTPTGSISVTAGLALIAFFVIQVTTIAKNGFGSWLHHLLGGAPWWLAPIMVPIEIISMFVKPFALMIRLFANMTAGHIILLSLVGLIFFFKSFAVAPLTIGFSLFTYSLELLVAFLQAYIFTILTAVFVGLAIGDHEEDHEYA